MTSRIEQILTATSEVMASSAALLARSAEELDVLVSRRIAA